MDDVIELRDGHDPHESTSTENEDGPMTTPTSAARMGDETPVAGTEPIGDSEPVASTVPMGDDVSMNGEDTGLEEAGLEEAGLEEAGLEEAGLEEAGLEEEEPAEPELGAPSLAAALEALLLMADDPASPGELAETCHSSEDEVIAVLHDLAAQYRNEQRGFELREVDGSWRYYTSVECAELVARFVTDGRRAKLSKAALETLAIVAYRQPVGRAHVASVRGVSADGVIRTLVQRGLVTEVSEDPSTGAMLFGTTTHFLDRMGIATISELPPIADHLPDLASLDDLVD